MDCRHEDKGRSKEARKGAVGITQVRDPGGLAQGSSHTSGKMYLGSDYLLKAVQTRSIWTTPVFAGANGKNGLAIY